MKSRPELAFEVGLDKPDNLDHTSLPASFILTLQWLKGLQLRKTPPALPLEARKGRIIKLIFIEVPRDLSFQAYKILDSLK